MSETDASGSRDPLGALLDGPDPETLRFNQELEATLRAGAPLESLPPAEIRAARDRGETLWGPVVPDPDAEERAIEVDDPATGGRAVPVRILRPPAGTAVRGVYLHLHGGGWTLGRAVYADRRNREISRLGLVTVSVDYRLAPEHPYPAGADDCAAVARWLVDSGGELAGDGREPALLIGGESAGAHLALITVLRLRDEGLSPFRAANLVYGCYDLSLTPSAATWGDRPLVLSTPIVEWFVRLYLGEGPAPRELDDEARRRRRDPDVSPLFADLRGLPPVLLTVGTDDPLLDDSLFLHARLRVAGVPVELGIHPGAAHGFDAFPLAASRRARRAIDAFLEGSLSAGSGG